jgi:hypothetical protein
MPDTRFRLRRINLDARIYKWFVVTVNSDFLDIEAVHVHYTCQKCGSEIIEGFTLADVFIDKG